MTTLRERQTLRLIADTPGGVPIPLLAAHGCDRDTLAILIRAGFVTETVGRATAGGKAVEIVRVEITEPGKRALR